MQVIGDAARLRQVLLNLAGNAIKFTSTGGVALIVEPGIWPNEISFLVRDTGIGIAPGGAASGSSGSSSRPTTASPAAMAAPASGSSISDRIVKRMGGRITLASTPGAGSTFEVSIPLAAADTGEINGFTAPDLSGQSIMLVAPQSIEASLISRRLQRWGGQTCMVSDADVAEALLPERQLARGPDRPRARPPAVSKRLGEAAPHPRHASYRDGHAGDAAGPCGRRDREPSPAIWSSRCARRRSRRA